MKMTGTSKVLSRSLTASNPELPSASWMSARMRPGRLVRASAIASARVRAMFVRADWTRRGLGRRILVECEAAARREGFGDLVLNATMPGLPLYLSYGFEAVDEIDVVMPDGVSIPCVSMRKAVNG